MKYKISRYDRVANAMELTFLGLVGTCGVAILAGAAVLLWRLAFSI